MVIYSIDCIIIQDDGFSGVLLVGRAIRQVSYYRQMVVFPIAHFDNHEDPGCEYTELEKP